MAANSWSSGASMGSYYHPDGANGAATYTNRSRYSAVRLRNLLQCRHDCMPFPLCKRLSVERPVAHNLHACCAPHFYCARARVVSRATHASATTPLVGMPNSCRACRVVLLTCPPDNAERRACRLRGAGLIARHGQLGGHGGIGREHLDQPPPQRAASRVSDGRHSRHDVLWRQAPCRLSATRRRRRSRRTAKPHAGHASGSRTQLQRAVLRTG